MTDTDSWTRTGYQRCFREKVKESEEWAKQKSDDSSAENITLNVPSTEDPESARRRLVETLMRSFSAEDVFFYDDTEDDALIDASDIIRKENERLDRRKKNKVVVHDASGLDIYLDQCKKKKILPNSQITRQLGNYQLQLRHNYLKEADVRALTAALKANTIVEDLDLSDNHLEDDLMVLLLSFLRENGFVSHLNLSQNFLRSQSLQKLCQTLANNTSVKSLALASNKFGDEDAKTIGDFLQATTTLTNLDMANNSFGEKGGIYLGAAIQLNDSLRELDLSWNNLRQKGGVAICQALKVNDSLEILDLSWNGLGFGGAVALKASLGANATLKVLDISNNRIEKEGAKHLAAGLAKNEALESLHLGQNPVGDEGIRALLQSAEAHPCLRVLDLKDVVVSHDNFALIHKLQSTKAIHIPTGGTWSGIKVDDYIPSSLEILNTFVIENNLRLVDVFNRFDKDKSGDISIVELKNGLKEIGVKMTNRQLDEMLKEIDTDNSGTMDYQEFLTSRIGVQLTIRDEKKAVKRAKRLKKIKIKRQMELPAVDKMKLVDLFTKFDQDRSGDITVAEFKIGLKEVGLRLTEVQIDNLVDELDADASGTIDYKEFKGKLLTADGAIEADKRATTLRSSLGTADGKKTEQNKPGKSVRIVTPSEEATQKTPSRKQLKTKSSSLNKLTSVAGGQEKKKPVMKKKASNLQATKKN